MIVIDTHVWIWWVDDHPKLRPDVRDPIDREDDVRVSAISLDEIATAISVGRLWQSPSARHWFNIAETAAQISIEPPTGDLCVDSANRPGTFHRDPGDRLIVALARKLDAKLVTADHNILAYPHVRTRAAV